MRIIYGYSNCTDSTYNRIVSERGVQTMAPDQKYHGLLIRGLSKNGAEVRCFSGLPVNRAVTARRLVREPDEREGSAYFHYITTLNFPVIRQLMIFFGSFFGVLKLKRAEETYAVCDFLNAAAALGVAFACKIRRIKRVAVVTDIPEMFDTGSFSKSLRNFVMRRFDGYILLTKYMSGFIPENAPYIVLEGHTDSDLEPGRSDEKYEKTIGKKIVIYAGNIQEKYGIKSLVEGFAAADIPECELWVYGSGGFRDELEKMAETNLNVKYMGVKSHAEVAAEEQRASLLVNPRPTAHEYTKCSFPSKNMEYMASGTPTLTTKLAGMPEEYYPYVYLIEDETEQGIADSLKKIFSLPFSERDKKAASAREFVLKKKSNVVQAKKIMDFLQGGF